MGRGIVRIWEGRVRPERADEYVALMRTTAVPDYRSVPGNRGAWILRSDGDGATRVATLTMWDSLDAVRAFAGDPVDRAKYYDFDPDYLLELPDRVAHFAVESDLVAPAGAVEPDAPTDADVGRDFGAACSLESEELRARLEAWRSLRARAIGIDPIPGGLRLAFAPGESLHDVGALVERESECCAFYRFALRVDGPARVLEITAGAGNEAAVRALLGADPPID